MKARIARYGGRARKVLPWALLAFASIASASAQTRISVVVTDASGTQHGYAVPWDIASPSIRDDLTVKKRRLRGLLVIPTQAYVRSLPDFRNAPDQGFVTITFSYMQVEELRTFFSHIFFRDDSEVLALGPSVFAGQS